MATPPAVWLGVAAVGGGVTLVLGLAMTALGLRSARNAYVAALGDETPLAALEGSEGRSVARFEGTVTDVVRAVRTAAGEPAAVYRFEAELRSYRNLLRKRRNYRELRADTADVGELVVRDADGSRALFSAPDGEDRWGNTQRGANSTGLLLTETHYVADDWTRRETYTDRAALPEEVVHYLGDAGGDTDLDLGRFGVRGLTVTENVAVAGDTLRVLGPVEVGHEPSPPDGLATAEGGGRGLPTVELTGGSTVSTAGWGTITREEAKQALMKVPMGIVFLGTCAAVVFFSLRNGGFV